MESTVETLPSVMNDAEFAPDDSSSALGLGASASTPTETPVSASAPASAPHPSGPPAPPSDTGADAGSEAPINPRKRKKASRACDFCHVNHQPCDNGKPKCSVCQKHNKPCLYLRPTKRRGPQKGYRTALNTYKESAAAWGAVLGAIPGLDALIEGHLRGSAGKSVVTSIKDSNQQDALITRWQQSSVFKAFFGHNGAPETTGGVPSGDSILQSREVEDDDLAPDEGGGSPHRPSKRLMQPASADQRSQSSPGFAVPEPRTPHLPPEASYFRKNSTSLSDIVAKDAALASSRASQTLASLGFAPNETIADFYSMGSNPEPTPRPTDLDFDPGLGSESEQRAYYELLMGRSFPG